MHTKEEEEKKASKDASENHCPTKDGLKQVGKSTSLKAHQYSNKHMKK